MIRAALLALPLLAALVSTQPAVALLVEGSWCATGTELPGGPGAGAPVRCAPTTYEPAELLVLLD